MEAFLARLPKRPTLLLYHHQRKFHFSASTPVSIQEASSVRCRNPNGISLNNHPYQLGCNNYSTTSTSPAISATPSKSKKSFSLVEKIREFFNWEKKPPKSVLRASGYLWYIKIADEVNFDAFYKVCQLQDTFSSWFNVLELHVWLVSTRLMEEPETGRIVRNSMIKAMWEDVEVRSRKLEGALSQARKQQIKELNEQFQASLLGYDEGLMTVGDTVLAGALWRKFLRPPSSETDGSPEPVKPNQSKRLLGEVVALELLVSYVRAEHFHLQQLSRERVLFKRDHVFESLDRNFPEMKRFHS